MLKVTMLTFQHIVVLSNFTANKTHFWAFSISLPFKKQYFETFYGIKQSHINKEKSEKW